MKINLKVDGDERVANCGSGGTEISWPEFKGFDDGATVYWNGTPYIYRRKDGGRATLELTPDSKIKGGDILISENNGPLQLVRSFGSTRAVQSSDQPVVKYEELSRRLQYSRRLGVDYKE